jgi:hypothetical protein
MSSYGFLAANHRLIIDLCYLILADILLSVALDLADLLVDDFVRALSSLSLALCLFVLLDYLALSSSFLLVCCLPRVFALSVADFFTGFSRFLALASSEVF